MYPLLRPAKWPIPVLTSSAPRRCVYKQTGHRGNNVNNLIQIPTNIWEFPSILCANARSVTNKIDELDAECQNKCIDVAGITETWLKYDIPSISQQLSGFYLPLRNDRNSRRGGGVACYVRQGIQYKHWEELQELCAETVWLTIMPKRLPRNISIIIIAHITRSLEFLLQIYPAAGVLLLGDFNTMITSRVTGSFHLKQIVDKPTRKGAILDKILTNMAEFYPAPDICSHLGKSNHNIITAIPCMGTTWKHRPCSKTIKTTRHVTTETKRTFAADLTAINWSSLYRLPTCQEQFDAFTSVLNSMIEEHFPTTTAVRHSNDNPCVTKGFKALVQYRQKALHEGDTDTYRRLRNKINRQRSRLKSSFYQSKVDKIGESNSRQWWKTIKTMIGIQPSKSHLCDLADQLRGGDTLALANTTNIVFKEVTSDLQPLLPAAASVYHDVPDEFIISVTVCEHKLSKLCVHKAMGPDNIPNWIITDLSYILASPIAAIYNSSLIQS